MTGSSGLSDVVNCENDLKEGDPRPSSSCGGLGREPDLVAVRFPDGTVVSALALREREEQDPDRDYGLYLHAVWRPTWNADIVDWEDMSLPRDYEATADLIHWAFERAKRGERVEVGCKGGLGRTGTVLACMAIEAGVPAGGKKGTGYLLGAKCLNSWMGDFNSWPLEGMTRTS